MLQKIKWIRWPKIIHFNHNYKDWKIYLDSLYFKINLMTRLFFLVLIIGYAVDNDISLRTKIKINTFLPIVDSKSKIVIIE